jgi:predicted DNA-binding protein
MPKRKRNPNAPEFQSVLLNLTPELRDRLYSFADDRGETVSATVRQFIRDGLNENNAA